MRKTYRGITDPRLKAAYEYWKKGNPVKLTQHGRQIVPADMKTDEEIEKEETTPKRPHIRVAGRY